MHTTRERETTSIRDPLRRPLFRSLWIASFFSMSGIWMHDAAAAWHMTSLSPSPLMVALVQTMAMLPVFLLALPAGALADIIDRRRYLIFAYGWTMLSALALGALTIAGLTTASVLLALTFALGIGHALYLPAFAATIPDLVPRRELFSALSLNSVAMNASRAIGPAIAGVLIGLTGPGGVFLLNGATLIVMIAVINRLPRAEKEATLPSERLLGAVRVGLRFVRQSTILRRILLHGATFFFAASAIVALMPIVARQELQGTAVTYGLMLSAFGLGAVMAAFAIPTLARKVARDRLLGIGCLTYAAMLAAIAEIRILWLLLPPLLISGMAWLVSLSCLQMAAQTCLPHWVRARGLSIYMMTVMGGMAAGSAAWGFVARFVTVEASLLAAAATIVLSHLLLRRLSIETAGVNLAPDTQWRDPSVAMPIDGDRGPVLATVEYRIRAEDVEKFQTLMPELRQMRRRNGAYSWGLFRDVADPERFTEVFLDESWLEHLRHHRRLTMDDAEIEARVNAFHSGEEGPRVIHSLSQKLPKVR